jgi:hypothetical protein
MACAHGRTDCAVELIRHGCDTKLLTTQGLTGWDAAKRQGHGVLIRRCKSAQKLAQRKAQQQSDKGNGGFAAAATIPDTITAIPQQDEDEDEEQLQKAAKQAAANRKQKKRKKAKKAAAAAAQQQLLSRTAEPDLQAEPEPAATVETESQAALAEPTEPEAEAGVMVKELEQLDAERGLNLIEPEPALDERKQLLQALTALSVQQWSAAQVLEWVALADLPTGSVSAVTAVIESLDLDGEELLELGLKTLQKKLTKHGAQDAEALAKQVIEQRDALLPGGNTAAAASPVPKESNSLECPICMEQFCDDESGLRVPRFLTGCGHTVCHGCITKLLSQGPAVKKNKKKKNGAKSCKCPSCEAVTEVEGGDATTLFRNYALASAVEEAV